MRFGFTRGFFAVLIALAASGAAEAQCAGGSLLKGGYGVAIYGMTAAGGTEALTGALIGNGKCGLTATLSGNIAGTEISQMPATGTYDIGPALVGSISITLAGGTPMIFAVNWVVRHRQIAGLESDGAGFAQIDAKLQEPTSFTQQTLKGSFAYLCSSPANQPVVLFSAVFDGVGGVMASGSQFQGNAVVPWGPENGSYTVNEDGSYVLALADMSGNGQSFGGVIDSSNYDAPIAEIAENGAGTIAGPAHCVGQRQ